MPRTYDPEFRRRVLELVRAGRPARVVAAELGLAEATVYRWKAQDLIDRGVRPGASSSERGELAAARRRIKELETEVVPWSDSSLPCYRYMSPYPTTSDLDPGQLVLIHHKSRTGFAESTVQRHAAWREAQPCRAENLEDR